ncbi:site-specific DNA-methyltransferase [Erysipelothrix inopinata]|uniref:Methyltransferase n=1 Tax=Erysipelothrix inopinata TaxID=225084 RepID=A0A7G9RW58_9FIRM|nr:site-specific DNA-methyltransferase [Erysipelothrix inopinata]QNN59833.1 site-specific DNA-methyltransferase [Erysipelothrix inopinata]
MKNINCNKKKIMIDEDDFVLMHGDSLKLLKKIEQNSVDMIFADPPYFLSNGGITVQSGKMVSVNKGEWDEGMSLEERHKFNRKWIRMCKNVLKDDGTIWISGTMHNIYSIGMALELEGFSIINNITWEKSNPPPNLACRSFTHSTETILWARKQLTSKKKGKHQFNYSVMKKINGGKQMKDVWTFSTTPQREKKCGKHPTQKPIAVLERIVLASTNKNDVVLDPFNGSGTTGIVCSMLGRRYIGIEQESEYIELTVNRLNSLKENKDD